ncbi:MAG: 3'-5' exonuclease, partial [Gammaproteobacteria bacterium]
ARSHLLEILPLLKSHNIAYHATEIEPLSKQPVIQDLLALTFALLDCDDRLAWLAVLRSPICGLPLDQIEILANDQTMRICDIIQNVTVLNLLTAESRARITRLAQALMPTLNARARMPLSRWLESAWLATGAAFYTTQKDLNNIAAYYQLLTDLENEYGHVDLHLINEHIEKLFTDELTVSDNPIQIMTIHKAKGLEFDAAFLPGLSRRPAINTPPLLRYIEQTLDAGTYWLLAPIHAKTAAHDPIYQYLARLEKHQQAFETQRLLYVALTRAKYQLYLFAVVNDEESRVSSQSLYGLLAPHLDPRHCEDLKISNDENLKASTNEVINQRIPLAWKLPKPWHEWLYQQPAEIILDNTVDVTAFHPQTIMKKQVGVLLHRILKYFAETGDKHYSMDKAKIQLLELGVASTQIDNGLNILSQAIKNILNDEKGQWILQPHQDALCEHVLHTYYKNKYTRMVIDRTFIADNIRWIIDYKTGQEAEDHSAQLKAYQHVMQKTDPRPIRLALYFPLTCTWKELE